MPRRFFLPLILLIIACTAVSCSFSLQKRRYRPGYTVVRHENGKTEKPGEPQALRPIADPVVMPKSTTGIRLQQELSIPQPQRMTVRSVLQSPVCDTLYFKDGKTFVVIIETFADDFIQFRKCETANGPLYTSDFKALSLIAYADGRRIVPQARIIRRPKHPGNFVVLGTGIAAVIFVLLGIAITWPFYIAAIVLGIAAVMMGLVWRRKDHKEAGLTGIILGALVIFPALLLFFIKMPL